MIYRVWHGTTLATNAENYEALLMNTVFPRIAEMRVEGYRGIQLLKSEKPGEVEFITIMAFESREAIKQFAGEDYEKSYVIDEAKLLLKSYDIKAQHFELVHNSISL